MINQIVDHSCNVCGEFNESVDAVMLNVGTYQFICKECGEEVVFFTDGVDYKLRRWCRE